LFYRLFSAGFKLYPRLFAPVANLRGSQYNRLKHFA
jgi:hypothetical protein